MTNTKPTRTNHYFRAVLAVLAMLAAMLVASGVAQAVSLTYGGFSNHSPIQIVDNGPANPYPSHINVQDLPGNITDVSVNFYGYSHTFPDDVDVLLVGPKGQKALLMSDVGGSSDVNGINLTLNDQAIESLSDASQIFPSNYKPTQGPTSGSMVPANFPAPAPAGPYAKNLSAFDGTDPNGTWDLYVLDDSGIDIGKFADGWSLGITTDGTIDNTPPRVTKVVPQPGATGVSPTANINATFSEEMMASTINGTTVQLFKKGSTTKLAATVFYRVVVTADGTAYKAMLDPANSLKSGATYKAVVTTGAKDAAGNRLDQNSTLSGLQQKAWFFTVKP